MDASLLAGASPRPPVDATRALAERFVAVAGIRRLGGERDANHLIEGVDGRRYVLKIVAAPEAEQSIPLQIAALDHLAEQAPDLPVPRVVRTRAGASLVELAEGAAWLLTFHDGALLSDSAPSGATLAALGETAGRLTRALADFAHPALARPLEWDLAQADAARRWLDHITNAETRRLAATALDLPSTYQTLPRQAVHGDLNPFNVIVAPDGNVAALIDFGDLHRGTRAADLAVAAAYHVSDPGAVALIATYAEAAQLVPEEVAAIPGLIAARLGMTLAITARRAAERPMDAAYLLRNAASAVAGLRWLANGGAAQLEADLVGGAVAR
ncbi:MAG: phosphotransferase [Sphingomonadaceae bacterium]|nr:phosphotransferase [Sphingomonadaceae bacterium]